MVIGQFDLGFNHPLLSRKFVPFHSFGIVGGAQHGAVIKAPDPVLTDGVTELGSLGKQCQGFLGVPLHPLAAVVQRAKPDHRGGVAQFHPLTIRRGGQGKILNGWGSRFVQRADLQDRLQIVRLGPGAP